MEKKYIMQKTICAIFLIFVSVASVASAANHRPMDSLNKLSGPSKNLHFYSAVRPKVEKNNENKTTLEEDMKSSDQGHNKHPTINAEDKVIEFIVTDIGR